MKEDGLIEPRLDNTTSWLESDVSAVTRFPVELRSIVTAKIQSIEV